MSNHSHFGKFHHIGEFLDHYKKWENNQRVDAIQQQHPNDVQAQVAKMKKAVPDLVELEATIKKFYGDQHEHYQFDITITKLVTPSDDAKVNEDVQSCIQNGTSVFLATRYGDNEGLSQPIREDLEPGLALHLKGQWITEDQAYSHNGAKMPVLHFTHHPVGFICVGQNCYS